MPQPLHTNPHHNVPPNAKLEQVNTHALQNCSPQHHSWRQQCHRSSNVSDSEQQFRCVSLLAQHNHMHGPCWHNCSMCMHVCATQSRQQCGCPYCASQQLCAHNTQAVQVLLRLCTCHYTTIRQVSIAPVTITLNTMA